MKLSNFTDWRTTTTAIIGGIVMIAGLLYPDRVTQDTGEIINSSVDSIIVGIGGLISVISGLFGSD